MKRVFHATLAVLSVLVASACEEELPTAEGGGLLPVSARTVEIRIPFEEFGREPRTFFGYGSASELGVGLVAREFFGADAHALLRFAGAPSGITVRDSTGAIVADSMLTFVGGRAVIRFDTLTAPGEPVSLGAGALQSPWDVRSATWTRGVDTVGTQVSWPEPGAGPVTVLDTLTWDPGEGDSVVVEVDSALVNAWTDTTDESRGLRLVGHTPGSRLRVRSAVLRLETRPSVNPDTLVTTSVGLSGLTFVYDPLPTAPEGPQLRIGGVPAWRTVLGIELPERIDEPNPACAQLSCPFELTPEGVILAALVLETRPVAEPFRPLDSLAVEMRPVLAPERLPKSPLGARLSSGSEAIPPGAFGQGGARQVSIPVTTYVQDLIRGETAAGNPVSPTVALVSSPEPRSFGFGVFAGEGDAPPFLRLILTLTDGVSLP